MDPKAIQSILDKITYKPGWTFELLSSTEPYVISVAATVKNARDNPTYDTLKMRMEVFCDNHTSQEVLLLDIAKTIAEIEVHESLEFFRFNNEVIFDPHQYLSPLLLVSKASK